MSHLTIAHVLSSFGLGGQERVAVDLAKAQRSAGHQVIAVSLSGSADGPIASAFRHAGVAIETVAKRHRFDVTLPVRLASRLTGWQVDVIHTHNPHALIYGAPTARLLRAAAVHSKHGINPDRARRLWLRRTAAKLVDAYVAVTPSLSQVALENRECAPDKLRVIPNGIDTGIHAPDPSARYRVRAELGIPEDAWLVGTVGRLAPEKDQGLLIDAMQELLGERCHLLIAGAGSEMEALRVRAAAAARQQFIHLVGARDDIPTLLAALDLFVLTSRTEGLPLVLLEAMATGLPVLTTAVGGIPDLVEHRVTGFLVPPHDLASLSKYLGWLSSRPHQAFEVANAGRQLVLARHTVSRMAQAYESLYRSVSTARRASSSTAVGAQGG
jgi:glycosyltransferase involved in cell wall biosynthesis